MSVEGYHKAMDQARRLAEFVRQTPATNQSYGAMCQAATMWATIAMAESAEPAKTNISIRPGGPWRAETVSERPPFERFVTDDGVVGVRCTECRHFKDNHGEAGCRECVCQRGVNLDRLRTSTEQQ